MTCRYGCVHRKLKYSIKNSSYHIFEHNLLYYFQCFKIHTLAHCNVLEFMLNYSSKPYDGVVHKWPRVFADLPMPIPPGDLERGSIEICSLRIFFRGLNSLIAHWYVVYLTRCLRWTKFIYAILVLLENNDQQLNQSALLLWEM